jgi:hypothetical protein
MTRFGRKVVTAPAAILGAAGLLLAGGGLAMAASHGALNAPFTGHDNRSTHAPTPSATANPGLTHATATEPADPESTEAASSASPSPSLKGLCVAFQAGATHDGKSNPAFDALTAAAGGADNVATYCDGLIGPSTKPTHPTHPAKPTQAAKPTHPAKPTHAAKPTHPAKPNRTAAPQAH